MSSSGSNCNLFSSLILYSLLFSTSLSYNIQPPQFTQQKSWISNFKPHNNIAIVALTIGLSISNPSISLSVENDVSNSLLSKSKVLKENSQNINLDNVKDARKKPLYEEMKYNRAIDDKNAVKENLDLTTKALKDSRNDLNSANVLMKKTEKELMILNKRIEYTKKQNNKKSELQNLYTEQSALRATIEKVF